MSFLNDWYSETIQPDKHGQHRGTGFMGAVLKPFVDEEALETKDQQTAVRSTLVGLGENPDDYNLDPRATVTDARGAAITTARGRKTAAEEKAHERGLEPTRLAIEAQGNQFAAQLAETQAQTAATNKRLDTQLIMQQNNIAEERAIRAENKADELALRREQMAREDHRYAQQMERYDKRKRQDSIQAMVAGLASLGAAFAL